MALINSNAKRHAERIAAGDRAAQKWWEDYLQSTAGTVEASKVVVVDANKDVTGFRNVTATGSFIIGSADMSETDLEKLDGITNGTQAANKAVVADANVNIGVVKATQLHIGTSGSETQVNATGAEINYIADASARIVTSTATALSLTVTQHAERVVLIESNSTVANTFTLPVATGSGVKMTLINNIAQTQGTVVVAANGTDVLQGLCLAMDSTAAADAMTFLTSATSDKVSLNLTTTGGLGGDMVEAWDKAANAWLVRVVINGSGSLGTPFSAT